MKKLVFNLVLMFAVITLTYSQGQFENCIFCGENELGKTSSAIGDGNQNLGDISLTIGRNNFIQKELQTVSLLGNENIAILSKKGSYSIALGTNNTIKADYSYVLGKDNIVDGKYGVAIGYGNQVSGMVSVALGSWCKTYRSYGVAIGKGCEADSMSTAIGFHAAALDNKCFAFGHFVKSSAKRSMTLGTGITNSTYLENSIENSLMVGFSSDVPTFFISSSDGSGTTGKIGIGNITSPEAKLHIKADDNEDASILLQPTGANYYAKLLFGENGNQIYAKSNDDLKFSTGSGKDFVFENGDVQIQTGFHLETESVITSQLQAPDVNGLNLTDMNGNGIFVADGGNVGIGTTTPSENLDVDGSIKSTGLQLLNGQQGMGKILQSDENGFAQWIEQSELDDGDWSTSGYNVYRLAGNVGIGKTNPTVKLDVVGDINFTEQLYKNGVLFTTSKWLENGNKIYYNSGNVGIGTSDPQKRLDIAGELRVHNVIEGNADGSSVKLIIKGSENENSSRIEIYKGAQPNERSIKFVTREGGNIQFFTDTKVRLQIRDDEIVIGKPEVQNHVDVKVNGHVLAREVEVTPGEWWDEVFDNDYKLTGLNDLETFINKNGHLPEIPTKEEVMESGIKVGEMQAILLKKIEELTLYVIELKKENEDMNKEIVKLKNE